MDQNKKNIVVIPISTLPLQSNKKIIKDSSKEFSLIHVFRKKRIKEPVRVSVLRKSKWIDGVIGDGSSGIYYHQQEPVLKWMLYHKDKIDTVILLCTNETKIERRFRIQCRGNEYKDVSMSSCDFLKSRFSDESLEWACVDIEEDREKTVSDLVKRLDSLKESTDDRIDVSFVMHGGFRDLQNVVDDVLDLIKMRDNVDVQRYTVEYDQSKRIGIVKQPEEIGLELFFAGLKEFLHTGRGEGLVEFFNSKEGGEKKNISDKIIAISDAIALCDMVQFEKGLDDLYDEFSEDKMEDDTISGLFVQYIKSDYGDILDKTRRTAINEIKWCIRKGFLQQALTLIESRMVDEMNNTLFRINWSWTPKDYDGSLEELIIENKKSIGMKWKENGNVLIEAWANDSFGKKGKQPFYKIQTVAYDSNDLSRFMNRIKSLRLRDQISICIKKKEKNELLGTVEIGDDEGIELFCDKKKLSTLIYLHMWIKEQRNQSNHGSNYRRRDSVESVTKVLNEYVRLFEELKIESLK